MDGPARLPVDCPRCENRGHIDLDAVLRSYSYIAPPMLGRYEPGQAYLTAQGHIFVVRYAYGEAVNWQELEDTARQVIAGYKYGPYGSGLYPCPPELAVQMVR